MKLAVIGCGLLGGSTAAAWRACGSVQEVIAFDPDRAGLQRALDCGIVDSVADSLQQAVAAADCIVLAPPVGAMDAALQACARYGRLDAIITDVGSTKEGIVRSARAALGDSLARFVPAHPIAGGALPGVEHASAGLFSGRWLITTPLPQTDPQVLRQVEAIWAACGARVERMDPAEHDRLFATVSHLPHLLAYALVHQIAGDADGSRMLQFAGAGFRDFTRIAASEPTLWRDIALANRTALAQALSTYRDEVTALLTAVEQGNAAALDRIFSLSSQVRRRQPFDADTPAAHGATGASPMSRTS